MHKLSLHRGYYCTSAPRGLSLSLRRRSVTQMVPRFVRTSKQVQSTRLVDPAYSLLSEWSRDGRYYRYQKYLCAVTQGIKYRRFAAYRYW